MIITLTAKPSVDQTLFVNQLEVNDAPGRARGDDIVEGLRLGTAAGAATAMTPGTSLGTDEEVYALLPHIKVEKVG